MQALCVVTKLTKFFTFVIYLISGNNNSNSDACALTEAPHRRCVIYTEKQLNCHALSC